jgi:hypothetical protein
LPDYQQKMNISLPPTLKIKVQFVPYTGSTPFANPEEGEMTLDNLMILIFNEVPLIEMMDKKK